MWSSLLPPFFRAQLVSEVEEAVQSEADEEKQMWLRASVYDCYDLLVMCDEFIHQVGRACRQVWGPCLCI